MEPRQMGFWKTDDPNEVLARQIPMSDQELGACLRYMMFARIRQEWRGYANCRFPLCGGKNGWTTLGSRDMITPDGKWVFPEKWDHYITEHGIRPDDDFVKDALAWVDKSTGDPFALTFTCSACGKSQIVIADPKKEVRDLAVLADWTPGIKAPDKLPAKVWLYAVLCPDCAANPATVKRLDFHADQGAFG